MSLLYLDDNNFEQEVLNSDLPVLVDFYADWCGPCKAVAPVIEELATEYEGRCKVAKLDVDKNSETAGKYGIMSIPTIILFKNGNNVEQLVGAFSKDKIKEVLDGKI